MKGTRSVRENPSSAPDAIEGAWQFEHLARAAQLAEADKAHAYELCAQTGEAPDQILTQLGLMTETDIGACYAEVSGLAFDPELELPDAWAELNEARDVRLNTEFLFRERILPLGRIDGQEQAVVVDPFNPHALSGLEFALGETSRLRLTSMTRFQRLFSQAYGLGETDEDTPTFDVAADADKLKDMASAAPVVRLVNQLIATAVERKASDLHIEPGARDAHIRFRVDGVMQEENALPTSQALAVISRIKVLADLDIAERRRPQDGRFSLPVAGRAIDMRVSVVPSQHGESLVLRLLDPDASLQTLERLGHSDQVAAVARACLSRPHGLMLVTGPTGSGKTTTLYAFLRELADGERKILTIEDPIEYRLPGIAQSQVNPLIGLDFAGALRSFLRHDPDVMMVGEIRDIETAQTAVQAAMTGHLVLSTLHTNDAPSAVMRLIDMGVEDYLLASTLTGVIGQRLVRKLCESCGGAGCDVCQNTGYRGRLALAEGFAVTPQMQDIIRTGMDTARLQSELDRQGYRTLAQDGADKVTQGLARHADVARTVGLIDTAALPGGLGEGGGLDPE